ncbi:MAG: methyltransferase domain-containing protein [Magnetococcales bacterium]|nr:methyltransferase domain-containing protein [Magnetococcales bacterium]
MPVSCDSPELMRVLWPGREASLPLEEVVAGLRGYARVAMDLGCGDARFVLARARLDPETLFVGVDLVAENMGRVASRAARKPTRGGAPNLMLWVADALALPLSLAQSADQVTVNCPWGALLRGVVEGDPQVLARMAMPLKPQGRLLIRLNLHTFQEEALRERLLLPALETEGPDARLLTGFRQAGLEVVRWDLSGSTDPAVRTTWGQRLGRGSRREILTIELCFQADIG